MTKRRHFEEDGAAYSRHRPTYPPELVDVLAAERPHAGHALDVGCGTGQLSVLLANRFDRVTATDPSETQIANATPHPRVTYAVEPAERIGLPSASVDLIVAAQAAHWFDLDAFYGEARRVARPGGVLAFVSYGVPELDEEVGDRFRRFYWRDIHRFWPAERSHVENGYRTLPFPFVERRLPRLTIEREWPLPDLLGYVETWSAAKRAREAGEGAIIDAFAAELGVTWGNPDERRRVRWPVVGRLATLSETE